MEGFSYLNFEFQLLQLNSTKIADYTFNLKMSGTKQLYLAFIVYYHFIFK